MKRAMLSVVVLCFAASLVMGCTKEPAQEEQPAETETQTEAKIPAEAEEKPQFSREGVDAITFAEGEKPHVKLETSLGTIVLELWPDVAPLHCKNFVYLTQNGFYDSLKIHRVISGFVLQGGCPLGNGSGGPGYTIEAEFSDNKHVKGTLSMARSQDPNSAGSQFFICLGPVPNLDGKYSVFGQAVEGMDVVDKFNHVKTKPNAYGENSTPVEPLYVTKATLLTE